MSVEVVAPAAIAWGLLGYMAVRVVADKLLLRTSGDKVRVPRQCQEGFAPHPSDQKRAPQFSELKDLGHLVLIVIQGERSRSLVLQELWGLWAGSALAAALQPAGRGQLLAPPGRCDPVP